VQQLIRPLVESIQQLKIRWELIRYIVFDSPRPLSTHNFEKRYSDLLANISCAHSFISIAPRILCLNKNHMRVYAKTIIKYGGEGAMLRQPSSLYEAGKSNALLKYKVVMDAEALVTRLDNNKCICTLPSKDGIVVKKRRSLHVKIGDVVSFALPLKKIQNKSFATIISVRHDLVWNDVVEHHTRILYN